MFFSKAWGLERGKGECNSGLGTLESTWEAFDEGFMEGVASESVPPSSEQAFSQFGHRPSAFGPCSHCRSVSPLMKSKHECHETYICKVFCAKYLSTTQRSAGHNGILEARRKFCNFSTEDLKQYTQTLTKSHSHDRQYLSLRSSSARVLCS